MATGGQPQRGLSAAELAAACAELESLVGWVLIDIAVLQVPAPAGDLLLVLQSPAADGGKAFLHIAPGGTRARVTLTSTRFPATAFARGPAADLLRRELAGAALQHVAAAPGERRCAFTFRTASGERRLVVELFGARGVWALLDAEGRCLALSRVVATAVRVLRLHDRYAPPPASGEPAAVAAPRFAPPVLAAIDRHFTRQDQRAAALERIERAVAQARRGAVRARAKVDGLSRQLADVGRADDLRATANLMLAYQHGLARGAESMTVPHPERDGESLVIQLDPARPVVVQAQALYEKARRLDDGRAIAASRLATAQQQLAAAERDLAAAEAVAVQFAATSPDAPDLLATLAALPFPEPVAAPKPASPSRTPGRDPTLGENVRRFVSAEGYPLWVGRNNEQNDRLTMRLANGNDLWLHVGGGRAGSHVIVRLPKHKTASLETLLDAGTLAVHFSKARGEHRIDVVYTQKKHVRKPKGLPPGAVVPSQTKTITVVRDEARLARLLAGSEPTDDA